MIPALSRVTWAPCFRLVPSIYPPIDLFESVADPADLETVKAIEEAFNPRVREEVGELHLVPPEDRLSGPGTGPIMAAFTHRNPAGSRFSDGSFGVLYAGRDRGTALAEVQHHQQQFLAETDEPAKELDYRMYLIDLDADLNDLRGRAADFPGVLDPEDYTESQRLGVRLKGEGSWGIAYDSVRNPGGECVGVLRPPALSNCRQGAHICLYWDGHRIAYSYRKSHYQPRA